MQPGVDGLARRRLRCSPQALGLRPRLDRGARGALAGHRGPDGAVRARPVAGRPPAAGAESHLLDGEGHLSIKVEGRRRDPRRPAASGGLADPRSSPARPAVVGCAVPPPGPGRPPTAPARGCSPPWRRRSGSLHGRRLLDLYAGSGAVGVEALSRGAEHVLLVENDCGRGRDRQAQPRRQSAWPEERSSVARPSSGW